MVPNARFLEFLADIEPSPTHKTNSSKVHDDVRYFLQTHVTFGDVWVRDFLAGSYSRDTAIRPRTVAGEVERADIDIIVVTQYDREDDPETILTDLSAILGEHYTVERVNKRSVRIVTRNADVDVVLVAEDGDIYIIPDRDLGGWKNTDPPGHNAWSAERNKDLANRFKPTVKLFKWWRRENPSGKRPKGFVLEVLVAHHMPSDETHYGEILAQTFENIHAAYADGADRDQKPRIADPALPWNDILDKVTVPQWKAFVEKCRVYGALARRAQDSDDMDEASRLWRRILGDRFAWTETVAKASVASAAFVTPAAASYSFPNAAAAPAKPRSFA